MEKIVRKFPRGSQRKVAAEIRAHCCNLWHGDKCLLLDNGMERRCTQLEADSFKYTWFRDAVLPGNPILLAEIQGVDNTKQCEICGAKFKAVGNRAKYCARCGKKVRRQQQAKWVREKRSAVDK